MTTKEMLQQELIRATEALVNLGTILKAGFSQQELIAMLSEKSAAPVENKADVIEASSPAPKKNGNGNGHAKKEQKSKYVGKEIEYGGGRAKIIGRSDDGGFTAKALTNLNVDDKDRERGHEFDVSNTYVYRQLKSKK